MSLPADARSILSVSTAVHEFDPAFDVPVVDEKLDLDVDPFLVRFAPGDPRNPKNWPKLQKWYMTMAGGLLVLCATFSSSAIATVIPDMKTVFGFSDEVGTLTISLSVAGYCVGPILWAPLSEQYGRRPIFIISLIGFLAFQLGTAASQNTATILILRFLGGTFSAAPLSNSGALIADIWGPKERGVALAAFVVAPFAGPGIAPTVSGYIVQSGVHWRWVLWVLAMFAGFCCLVAIFTMPETFEPVILAKMAKEKRKSTGDERYYATIETITMTVSQRIEAVIQRPFKILIQEPILIAITAYMSFVYGCIYLLFEAYPIVYTAGHNLGPGPSGLVYLPLPIGSLLSVTVFVLYVNKVYMRKAAELAPEPVPPEYRLHAPMIAAPVLTISFFWFAWTSYPSVSIWAPMASALFLGFSICWIFLGLFNYIIDVYLFVSASAIASSTVVRSAVGAGFPLFASQMYKKLGPEWASSLVGFISLLLTPVPFVLARYGADIRAKSKFAPPRPSFKLPA